MTELKDCHDEWQCTEETANACKVRSSITKTGDVCPFTDKMFARPT